MSVGRFAWPGRARPFMLVVLALLVAPGRGPARPGPAEEQGPEWIRPEEIPSRADALLRQLEAARPGAAAESSLAAIERSLPRLGRDLDIILQQTSDAVERSAPGELEDAQRELTDVAAPLAGWKNDLSTEAARVAKTLDLVARGQHTWSQTRARPETVAAGEVVVRRVDSSLEALNQAATSLHAWRARVLAASDEVIERAGAADAALEKLRAAGEVERANLFVPTRPPLWSGGLGGELRSELPRVPAAI